MAASVIVFDGVCMLCSRWVDFVLRRDPHGRYKFAAMQTASGRALLIEHGIDPDDPLSFVRDPLYRWIARNRYRMFGRRAACRVPTADIADRFLQ
jgi:predicted DCC family thiol-disulfide oxidoreductase YuxK